MNLNLIFSERSEAYPDYSALSKLSDLITYPMLIDCSTFDSNIKAQNISNQYMYSCGNSKTWFRDQFKIMYTVFEVKTEPYRSKAKNLELAQNWGQKSFFSDASLRNHQCA